MRTGDLPGQSGTRVPDANSCVHVLRTQHCISHKILQENAQQYIKWTPMKSLRHGGKNTLYFLTFNKSGAFHFFHFHRNGISFISSTYRFKRTPGDSPWPVVVKKKKKKPTRTFKISKDKMLWERLKITCTVFYSYDMSQVFSFVLNTLLRPSQHILK